MMTYRDTARRKAKDPSLLLIPGILACVLAILSSLYIMYRPFTSEDVFTAAENAGYFLYEQAFRLSEKLGFQEGRPVLAAAPLCSGVDSMGGFLTADDIPFIESSGQMGYLLGFDPDHAQTLDTTYVAMLDTCAGPMLYYHQGDRRWGDFLYGGADPMSKYGCGPTAVSMIVNSFTPYPVTPVEIAQWSYDNHYYALHSGSYHSLIPEALSAYGLPAASVTDRSPEHVSDLLESGHILIALMGQGSLTENGHFVLFTRLLDNGNIRIADPADYENCAKEWNLEELLSELKKSYDSGGPLWTVQP